MPWTGSARNLALVCADNHRFCLACRTGGKYSLWLVGLSAPTAEHGEGAGSNPVSLSVLFRGAGSLRPPDGTQRNSRTGRKIDDLRYRNEHFWMRGSAEWIPLAGGLNEFS